MLTEFREKIAGKVREFVKTARLHFVNWLVQDLPLPEPQPQRQVLSSPYRDSTQFGVACRGTFEPKAWLAGDGMLPTVTGSTRTIHAVKPFKAIADEQLIFTFSNKEHGETSVAYDVEDAGDLLLTGAFAGTANCFPGVSDQSTGVSGRALASRSLGNGVSWPIVPKGGSLTITYAIRRVRERQ